ncbi:hypothetical protein E2C01_053869 [Portunus trituberculatus]|uniref:Uncharacterized protein n=1 Tax=Portunus trituberculatus TaxID=210409 RepID=A0A5B7GIC9_PORTR|nr:hypothetical protein [Portunus trituberculatus]
MVGGSDMPKTSTLEYKPGLHSPSLHCPPKADGQKTMEGFKCIYGRRSRQLVPSHSSSVSHIALFYFFHRVTLLRLQILECMK